MRLIIASLQPANPRGSGTTYFPTEISRPLGGSDATGGKNVTLVLGTGCVTQATSLVSCVPLRGQADEDSGSNPGCTPL